VGWLGGRARPNQWAKCGRKATSPLGIAPPVGRRLPRLLAPRSRVERQGRLPNPACRNSHPKLFQESMAKTARRLSYTVTDLRPAWGRQRGRPVVFHHGVAASAQIFDGWLPVIAAQHLVALFDMPASSGCSHSSPTVILDSGNSVAARAVAGKPWSTSIPQSRCTAKWRWGTGWSRRRRKYINLDNSDRQGQACPGAGMSA
jgi:hypothetical protein